VSRKCVYQENNRRRRNGKHSHRFIGRRSQCSAEMPAMIEEGSIVGAISQSSDRESSAFANFGAFFLVLAFCDAG